MSPNTLAVSEDLYLILFYVILRCFVGRLSIAAVVVLIIPKR